MDSKIILKAESLDGYLTESDQDCLTQLENLYRRAEAIFRKAEKQGLPSDPPEKEELVSLYEQMGNLMQEVCRKESRLHVYSFSADAGNRAEASRVMAKLRDKKTGHGEFVYYTQRAYEMLFKSAYTGKLPAEKAYLTVQTPVTDPVCPYAVHKIPDIDALIGNSAMCVMLRGALLPSMIFSKEIQEYSSCGYLTPFALFKIKRDESRHEQDMEYILDPDQSFFDPAVLDGKDLLFADPMNATGGSLVAVIRYLLSQGVRPKSVRFFNVIAALKGALRVVRAIEDSTVHTLWMDPALNASAYILPGLGDAGDRLNGADNPDAPRHLIRLTADYGLTVNNLYRDQLREIERTVFERK